MTMALVAVTRENGTSAGTAREEYEQYVSVAARDATATEAPYYDAPEGSTVANELARRFRQFATTWKNETGMYSVDTRKVAHPAYLKIVGMGSEVIPLIFQDLEEHGGHWYQALEALLGFNPMDGIGGLSIRELKTMWLDWGRQHGYLL